MNVNLQPLIDVGVKYVEFQMWWTVVQPFIGVGIIIVLLFAIIGCIKWAIGG